jgi:sugar/nucleoside kinase (ribokinase family)
MSLLAVGTLAFDSVETPFGIRDGVLGGSASFLSVAASYFCPVRMLGVIGADFPPEHLAFFKSRSIDTSGVTVLEGKTFRWRGRYDANLNVAHTLETQLNVLSDFHPELPDTYRDSEYVVLGNIDPDLQIRVLDQLRKPRMVTCDTMNYWIDKHRNRLATALKRADLLCINDGEARLLSGEDNLVKAAQTIRRLGPKNLVIKRGEHGAMLFSDQGMFSAPGFPLEQVLDPTGAGDSFAGGMMGLLARKGSIDLASIKQAIIMGSVIASYAVQDFSIDRLRRLTPEEIRVRFAEYKALTDFETEGAMVWA